MNGTTTKTKDSSSFDVQAFFEKFGLLTGTPNAIEQLRSLILHIAFRGALVQSASDSKSDSNLLAAIDDDVESLAGKKRSNSRKQIVEPDSWPYELPESWDWTVLGRIANWGSGSTPNRGNPEFYNGTTTWLKSGELNDSRNLIGSEERITDVAIQKGSFRLNQKGDVLFAMYGATVGKVAILGESAVTNQAVCGCTPSKYILNLFLYYYLISQRQQFRESSEGGAQPNFSKDKIVSYPFPVPPLAEQKRIVAKVDELMGLCDRLEAEQAERQTRHAALARAALARFADSPIPTNLQFIFHKSYDISPAELRKAVLNLALKGRLTRQDASEQDATDLEAKGNHVTLGDGTEPPYDIPSNWSWKLFGSQCELINGDRSKNYPNKSEYVINGVPWINTGHIEPDGSLDMQSMHYITREKFDSLRSGKIQREDLLYCLRGATFGKTAVVTQFDEGAIASSLVIIRLASSIAPRFAYFYLTSPLGRSQIFRFDNGSAQPNLSANSLKKYHFPLAPLAEQKRIVAKVDQLMALVDELEQQLVESCSKAEQLMQAVVAEMVKQD